MASLLIKNIRPRLHDLLKQRAAANRLSLNSEAIIVLENAMGAAPLEAPATSGGPVPDLSEAALENLPPETAARLRAFRELGESLAGRQVDFAQWKQTARDSRR